MPAPRALPVSTSPPLTLGGWLRHDAIRRAWRLTEGVTSVLEVGAGEGAMGVRLAAIADYTGLEPDPLAFAEARRRLAGRGAILNGDLGVLDPALRFDLVCAFEVLEHLPEPAAALDEWRGRLRPGGWLLVTVPAGERHFGAADRRVGHFRRFEPAGLRRLLEGAGLELLILERFGFPLGYALEAARNVVAARQESARSQAERTGTSGRWFQPPDALAWGTRAATAPFRAVERVVRPQRLGTSLLALARDPG